MNEIFDEEYYRKMREHYESKGVRCKNVKHLSELEGEKGLIIFPLISHTVDDEEKNMRRFCTMQTKNKGKRMSTIIYKELIIGRRVNVPEMSEETGIPVSVLRDILNNKQPVTEEISKKIGRGFGYSEKYFYELQQKLDERKRN